MVMFIVIDPSLCPHVAWVTNSLSVIAGGGDSVLVAVIVHPFPSVTVTTYVPEQRLGLLAVKTVLLHWYV